jgi:uncharacterized protein YjiK
MWKRILCGVIILSAVCIAFISFRHRKHDYKLAAPEKVYILPAVLHEISGITPLNENEIACVQDELGEIYIYDLRKEKITKEYKTGLVGDYEGITLAGNTLYLLRSDGVLVEYPDYHTPGMKTHEYFLNLPSSNNEGLCYDQRNYRLLIAAKIKPGKDKSTKDERYIYQFDLKTKIPDNKPIIRLNTEEIGAHAVNTGIPVPEKTDKKKGKKPAPFNFRPSEIAVHPFNKNIYVLSANDKLLLIMDEKGSIKHLLPLDPVLFNKAEGLAFLADGTMLISNEGQKGEPTLLEFKYEK